MKISRTIILLMITMCLVAISSYAEDIMVRVEQTMPVLKGDTWIKMSEDEKISFIWGAGHIVSIEDVLARDNPDLKKSNTFVNKIMEAHGNKPMTMKEVANHVDNYYKANPDKLDKPVIEVIWHETVIPRLSTTKKTEEPAQ